VGELSPVTLGSYGVVNWVSVLVSVADPEPPKPLLHLQFGLEARVGIEQVSQLSKIPPKPFGSGNFSKCCTDKEINTDK
jgi:hypothetical protein